MASNPYTTNLELQLDARDITGLTDGDSVTTWTDSSAAGNDVTQATSSRRPVYKTSIIGSNPVVRFASDNTKSLYASLASSWSGYGGVTCFLLGQWYENNGANYSGMLSMHAGSGNDFSIADGFVLAGGTADGLETYSRSSYLLVSNSTNYYRPVGALRVGQPSLFGFALQQGSNGLKLISEYGAYDTGFSIQISGTPTGLVLANRFLSGSVSTTSGGRIDLGAVLIYKEYMSDSNIGDVVDWILTEFDLHTQAAGGSGGVLIRPGMTGGMIG